MRYKSEAEKIRFLEAELYQIRHTLLNLLPDDVQEIARNYYHLNSRTEVYEWLEKIIEATTSIASLSAEEYYYSGTKSYCPLCKRGSQGPYGGGFVLPVGLQKHLLGEGNAHECSVLSQIRKLAKENWEPRVEKAEAEAEEKAKKELEMEKRRKNEELYKVNPVDPPKLYDELFLAEARDKESLEWAINRLQHLGFDETTKDRVHCFTINFEDLIVFADPREKERINFDTYHLDGKSKRRGRMPRHSTFYILDTWKNDLPNKLEKRIKKAQELLQRKTK